jgi:hypothetical protein
MRALSDIRPLSRVAARQFGNVTTAQLRAHRLSRGSQERLIEAGWLIPRHRGVYALGHRPRSRHSIWMAGVLALGDQAVLSHRAAGALWGIVTSAVPTEVTVPRGTGVEHRDGLIVHRQPLPPEHLGERDGIPTTTLLRTLLDLAMVLRTRQLARAFEQAQVLHHLPPEPLAAEVLSRRGYRGNARLRAILQGAVDPARVRSILELRFLRLCARHGLPRPLVNEPFGEWTLDFFWPDRGTVVETDGFEFHRTAAARRRDARRDAALHQAGLRVVRLTWWQVTERPRQAAALVG